MEKVMADKETWENLSQQPAVVPSVNFRGEVSQRIIPPGRSFQITAEERQTYQQRIDDPKRDKFMNGTYQAVKLVETAEDYAEIMDAPDRLSEDDLKDILKGQAKTVSNKVADIDNPVTVKRLLDLANESDAPGSKITVLEERYEELTRRENEPLNDAPDM
jgi:hypothetical protein